jgi:amidohydrolase
MTDLRDLVQDGLETSIAIRHDLHTHPELGFQEVRTSGVVQRELAALGIQHVGGLAKGTGVLGYLPATVPGAPTIALRADMDALPIEENTGLPYRSSKPGVMHACGHDGHTSILLNVARTLSKIDNRPNDVLFLFQPAEEGGAGGKRMCEDGVLQGRVLGRKTDMIYGLHGFPALHVGEASTRVGPMMAAASEFHIRVKGKGAHAAYPHMGVDPIVAAAHIVTALQTIASRSVGPLDSVVVTVGEFKAGVAHNVIPDEALLHGTLRTLQPNTDLLARRRMEEIVSGVGGALGADAKVEWGANPYPVVVNHPLPTERFRRIAGPAIGADKLHEEPNPSMGGEDFAFYGLEVPACFFWLGLLPPDREAYPNLHSPEFDFNDAAIPTGTALMCELALNSL